MSKACYRCTKRCCDFVLACIGLTMIWPILVVIAVTIKCTSPGPVFYRGRRTGLNGKPFLIWKFRSMIVDGEKRGGTTTGRDDARVTPIGRFLRKYKLDELPQLLNVLFGEMSFVGPRPEVDEYTDAYTAEERRILSVRPGITDWASIKFSDLQQHVGGDDPDRVFREQILPQKNQLRLKYVNEQSAIADLSILLRTFCVFFMKPFRWS